LAVQLTEPCSFFSFPGLELLPFGFARFALFLQFVELLLLFRLEQRANLAVGLVVAGLELILHGFLVGCGQLVQVAFGDLVAVFHLLAHQFTDLLALLAAQVQLGKGGITAMMGAVVAWAAIRHGHGHGWQGSGEHQGDKGLAHGVSPVMGRCLPDVPSLGRSRSSAVSST